MVFCIVMNASQRVSIYCMNTDCHIRSRSRPSVNTQDITECPEVIDPSHKSHSASEKNHTMHHFVTEMCAHVPISATKCCTVGCGTGDLLDSCNKSILYIYNEGARSCFSSLRWLKLPESNWCVLFFGHNFFISVLDNEWKHPSTYVTVTSFKGS